MHETFRIEIDGEPGACARALADALARALGDRGLGVERADRDGALALIVTPGPGRAQVGSAPAPGVAIELRLEAGGSALHLSMDHAPETLVIPWSAGRTADAGDPSPILHALEDAGRIPRGPAGRLSPEQERMLLLRLEKLGYL